MRALVALPLLLAACAPSPVATQTMLEERGVLRPVVSEGDWLFGPCGWSSPSSRASPAGSRGGS